MRFSTRAIHAGQEPDPSTGSIMTPIHQTSTFVQSSPGEHQGYEYSRTGNPTRTALETNIAALESGRWGLCFGSGLAATDAVMKLLDSGDHVVAGDDLYGGTFRLFEQVFKRFGVESDFSWTTAIGLHYRISDVTSVELQYKALGVDYDEGTRGTPGFFSYDTITHGPLIGVSFEF